MVFLVFNCKLLAIVSSHLCATQKYPSHMYKETFLPIGVASVTLQQNFSDYKVRIAMPCCYFSSFMAFQLALRVPPAETWLTVYCWLLIYTRNQSEPAIQPIICEDFLVFNLTLLAIVSSHLGAPQKYPRHMYKETF